MISTSSCKDSPLAARFASLETCHWNAITGENRWGDCNLAIVPSLPYLPAPAALSTTMAALEREMENDQLNADLAELKQVRAMRMAAEITQLIGRLQRSTQPEPTTVFLRLPDHEQQIVPDRLLDLIQAALRGARASEWPEATRKTPRPGGGQYERHALQGAVEIFVAEFKGATVSANAVREAVGASTSTWGRFLQRTKRVGSFKVVRPTVSGLGRETVFKRISQ